MFILVEVSLSVQDYGGMRKDCVLILPEGEWVGGGGRGARRGKLGTGSGCNNGDDMDHGLSVVFWTHPLLVSKSCPKTFFKGKTHYKIMICDEG